MSDFAMILRVKPPKPSKLHDGRVMVKVMSNVRIPEHALRSLEQINQSPFRTNWPARDSIAIERFRNNHLLLVHLAPELWSIAGDSVLEALASAPSNARRHFPVRIYHEERVTCKVTKIVEYPVH